MADTVSLSEGNRAFDSLTRMLWNHRAPKVGVFDHKFDNFEKSGSWMERTLADPVV